MVYTYTTDSGHCTHLSPATHHVSELMKQVTNCSKNRTDTFPYIIIIHEVGKSVLSIEDRHRTRLPLFYLMHFCPLYVIVMTYMYMYMYGIVH